MLDYSLLMNQEKFDLFKQEVEDVFDWLGAQSYDYAETHVTDLEIASRGLWKVKKEDVKDFNNVIAATFNSIQWTGYRSSDQYVDWLCKFLGVELSDWWREI